MTKPDTLYRYTGKDPIEAHHGGIPARDLTQADYDALDKEHRETVRRSAIYEKVEHKEEKGEKTRPAAASAPEKAEATKDAPKK